jgi:hypothetical protein
MNLEGICSALKTKSNSLKILYLQGNPLSMISNYKKYVLSELKELRMMDDTEIQQTQSSKSKQVEKDEKVSLSNMATLDFIITVAGDIQGTMIDEEIWEATGSKVVYDNLEDNLKSSKYWIEVPFMNGEMIQSEKKLWHKEFAREETKGRTDFNVRLRKEVPVSLEL